MRSRLLSLAIVAATSACGDTEDPARPGKAGDYENVPPPGTDAPIEPPSPSVLPRIAPPVDVVSTDGAISEWARIVPGVEARAITSYDRGGGNDDGFGGTYSELYATANGDEHVIFDAAGPGVLRTLWFTSAVDGNGPLSLGTVKFYFDDEAKPRYAVDADALFAGASAPFVAPLVAGNQVSSGGFASWVPLVYRGRLKITTATRPGFYQAFYDSLPADWDVTSGPARDGELAARFTEVGAAGADAFSKLALTDVPLDHAISGAGVIDVLRFEPTAGSATRAELQAARIKIFFDGASEAQVDVPLGMFFGSGLGETKVRAMPWTMDVGRYESRLPMPYWEGARIVVSGLAGKMSIHVAPAREPRPEYGTLHAIHSEQKPTTAAGDFPYATLTGAGKLVGTVLTIEPTSPDNKQWWEGDLQSFVDDAITPNVHGTGHEDDHLGGWSNEFLERPFSLPMQGNPKTVILDKAPGAQTNADASMYRLYPGIPFLRGIRHSTEHGPSNQRQSNYSAATFVYRQMRERLVMTSDVAFKENVALAVRPDNAGVKLRFAFDGAQTQRLRVSVDGVTVGSWYVPKNVTPPAAAESDYFLPPQLTKGKATLSVSLVPEGTSGTTRVSAWSVLP